MRGTSSAQPTRRRRSAYDDALLRSLDPDAAREFAALLQAQARDEAHNRRLVAAPDAGELFSSRLANYAYGAGGGRKRPSLEGPA